THIQSMQRFQHQQEQHQQEQQQHQQQEQEHQLDSSCSWVALV
ncbi:hypothetical protein AWZ03_014083, partial [Drosophila navojoa]